MKARFPLFCILMLVMLTAFSVVSAAGPSGAVSLNCKNSDVRDVLRGLGERCGINIVIDPSVTGTITMNLSDVSFDTALKAICEATDLTALKEGSVYRVVKVTYVVTFADGRLSIQARDADLQALWQEIARKTGLNIVPDRGVTGKASLVLTSLPPEQAVTVLAQASSATVEKRDDIFYIHPSFVPASENVKVTYSEGRLSVEANNAEVSGIIRQVTLQTGITLVADSNVAGNIRIAFKNLPLAEGLRLLFESSGFRLVQIDPTYYRITRSDGFLFIKFQDGKLTMDVRNVDIQTVADELSRQTRKNFLLEQNTSEKLSGSFKDMGLSSGLTAFFEANGLSIEQRTDLYYISRKTSEKGLAVLLRDDGRLDIDANTAPLNLVFREIANRTGINLVLYGSVNWLLNDVQLHGVTLEEAFNLLLKGTSYTWKKAEGTYFVADGVTQRPDSGDIMEVGIIVCHYLTAETVFNTLPPFLPQANFRVIKEQNVLAVTGARPFIDKAREYVALIDRPAEEVSSDIIRLNNMRAEDALKLLPASIPKNDVQVLREANALAVTGTRAYIKQVREYIEKIDLPVPLILFDILILQVNHNKDLSFSAGLTFQYGNVLVKLNNGMTEVSVTSTPSIGVTASLSTLIDQGLVEVVANPKIATLSGHQASFQVVTKHRYAITETQTGSNNQTQTATSMQTVDAGIDLSLSPWVSADRQITLDIKPKISEYTGSLDATPGAVTLPTTNERSTETTVRVRDGQTIIISGLIQKTTRKIIRKVPLLGDIPLIGLLFRKTQIINEQTEFIILVKPKLIEDPSEMEQYMGSLGQAVEQLTQPQAPSPAPPAKTKESPPEEVKEPRPFREP